MKYYGSLGRVWEGATRFHALETYPQALGTPDTRHNWARFKTPDVTLKNGDRIKVFNSIAAGDVFWQGELDFGRKSPNDGAPPKGLGKAQWQALFNAKMPVRLTRGDGEVIEGMLNKWNDFDGPDIYDIFDFKNNSYQSLHNFKQGDVMEIFSGVTEGNIVWEGEVRALSFALPTGKNTLAFDENGYATQKRVPEYVGNPLVSPSVKEIKDWQLYLPIMLERDGP